MSVVDRTSGIQSPPHAGRTAGPGTRTGGEEGADLTPAVRAESGAALGGGGVPRKVTINGREWEVGEDGTLLDRRLTPQDGIRLNRGERVCLQLMRICGQLPLVDLAGRLTEEGLVNELGLLTPEGALLADILLADPAD